MCMCMVRRIVEVVLLGEELVVEHIVLAIVLAIVVWELPPEDGPPVDNSATKWK